MPERTSDEHAAGTVSLSHRLMRMTGRDPAEPHRAATPLELLFDLAFVVAFRVAANELAHGIAAGHTAPAVVAFVFAIAATCWAWINFSWFSSAYDTDDWVHRLTTLLQMTGVVVFALGIPTFYESLVEGEHVDAAAIVGGYVVMRVALIMQWLRVAVQDPRHRRTAISYAIWVGAAQLAWVVLGLARPTPAAFLVVAAALFCVEFFGPVRAEHRTDGTPWHPHHIAERYGLLALIALGEGVFGTVAAVSVLVEHHGWSLDAALVVLAGVGLTFGLWWTYFLMPSGEALALHRRKAFVWGYTHILIFGSIAATGAGLDVAAYVVDGNAVVGVLGAITSIAIPVLVFSICLFSLYTYMLGEFDPLHVGLFVGTVVMLALALLLAAGGATLGLCLVLVTLSPAVVVVGYELVGHRHQADALVRLAAKAGD